MRVIDIYLPIYTYYKYYKADSFQIHRIGQFVTLKISQIYDHYITLHYDIVLEKVLPIIDITYQLHGSSIALDHSRVSHP